MGTKNTLGCLLKKLKEHQRTSNPSTKLQNVKEVHGSKKNMPQCCIVQKESNTDKIKLIFLLAKEEIDYMILNQQLNRLNMKMTTEGKGALRKKVK